MAFPLTTLLLLTTTTILPSQTLLRQTLASAGNAQASNGLCITWTFGQPIAGTSVGNNLVLRQGFQQPDGSGCNTVPAHEVEAIEAQLFPNPFNDILHVQLPFAGESVWVARLCDGFGQLLLEIPIENGSADISLDHLPQALYFVVLNNQRTGQKQVHKLVKMKP